MTRLTEQQISFFAAFGYVALPGLVGDCIDEITAAFEEVFTQHGGGHDGTARSVIIPFIDRNERLCALLDDPRIEGALASLLGDDFNYLSSDGNYYTGNTHWHSDGGTDHHLDVKVAFYLDSLTRETGALRVIPGSHQGGDRFAGAMERQIKQSAEKWGVADRDVPCVAVETTPGDVLIFDHRIKHASFGGSKRRRMFTMNCTQRYPDQNLDELRKQISTLARPGADRLYGETMIATASPRRMVHLEQALANDGHLAARAAKAKATQLEPARR